MKPGATLALLTLAGFPAIAAAQEYITYSWTCFEVEANTSTPVAGSNGLVEPGEGVRLALTATVTPGIGSVVTYVPPPQPGVGTLAGLGSIFFDLLGTNADGGAWTVIRRNPGGINWGLGPAGTGQPSGDLVSAGAGQFVLPGATVNSTNPVVNIWIGTWTPASYAPRTASFQSAAAAAAGGNHSSILIQYGNDPNPQKPLVVGRFIDGIFGNSGPISIVPAPAGAAVVFLGALAAARRRRSIHNVYKAPLP
jgi:hypothetical protein